MIGLYLLYLVALMHTQYEGVQSAVAILLPVEKPPEFASQSGCYVPSLKRVLPYNAPYSPQDGTACIQYVCNSSNTTIIKSCGAVAAGEGCTIVPGNLYLPYSECCPTIKCSESGNDVTGDNETTATSPTSSTSATVTTSITATTAPSSPNDL